MQTTLAPMGSTITNATDNATFQGILNDIPMAFGIICAIFFVTGLVLIFVLESWSDEPEYYYRQ
jgi:threonine/homoserine/homoserine lactone efflux protein